MSETGDENPNPQDPVSPVSPAVEGAEAAGAGEGMGLYHGVDEGSVTQVTCETEVACEAQVIELGVTEEVVGMEEVEADRESSSSSLSFSSSASSSIGPVEEEQGGDQANRVVDPRQFPMVNFRFTFMDMVRSILQHTYYKNHLITQPRHNHQMRRLGPPPPAFAATLAEPLSTGLRPAPSLRPGPIPSPSPGPSQLPVLHVPPWPRVEVPCQGQGQGQSQGQGEGEGEAQPEAVVSVPDVEEPMDCGAATAVVEASEEPSNETAKSGEQTADKAVTQYRDENQSDDDDEDFGSEEEKEAKEKSEKEIKNQ